MGNEPRRYDLVTSAAHQFLPLALHGQHLNIGQVLMGAIEAGNGGKVSVHRCDPAVASTASDQSSPFADQHGNGSSARKQSFAEIRVAHRQSTSERTTRLVQLCRPTRVRLHNYDPLSGECASLFFLARTIGLATVQSSARFVFVLVEMILHAP